LGDASIQVAIDGVARSIVVSAIISGELTDDVPCRAVATDGTDTVTADTLSIANVDRTECNRMNLAIESLGSGVKVRVEYGTGSTVRVSAWQEVG
jgi:hypothetical protein